MLKFKGKTRRELQWLSWPRHGINIKRVPWMLPFLVFSHKERLAHQGIWFSQKWIISSKQMLIGKTLSPVLHRKLDSTIKCGFFFFLSGYKNMWLLPESEQCSYKGISCSLQGKNIGKWVGTGKPAIREAPIMRYSCPAGGCGFPGKRNISIYIKQNLPPFFLRSCKWNSSWFLVVPQALERPLCSSNLPCTERHITHTHKMMWTLCSSVRKEKEFNSVVHPA